MLQSKVEFSGRTFSPADLDLIREIARDFSNLSMIDSSWGAGVRGCLRAWEPGSLGARGVGRSIRSSCEESMGWD
jgi:hypothetical protein